MTTSRNRLGRRPEALPRREEKIILRRIATIVSRIAGVMLAASTIWLVYHLPFAGIGVAGALLACGALQARCPDARPIALPALLPLFDLPRCRARLYLNEFDLLHLPTA